MKLFALAGALLCALVALAVPALAQDTNVQIGGIWGSLRPYIADLFGLLVAAAVAYVAKIIKDRFGIEIEAKHRDALHSAAVTGINMALGQLDGRMDKLSIDVKNKVLADAMNYAIKAAPDAMKYFGIDEKSRMLADLLKAKLTVALPGPSA